MWHANEGVVSQMRLRYYTLKFESRRSYEQVTAYIHTHAGDWSC